MVKVEHLKSKKGNAYVIVYRMFEEKSDPKIETAKFRSY